MIIAINMKFWQTYYHQQVSMGIMNYAVRHPSIQLHMIHNDLILGPEAPPRIDGVVGYGPRRRFAPENVPMVSVFSNELSGIPRVHTDNRKVGQMAFESLRSLGLRQFAVLEFDNFLCLRGESFVESCRAHGFLPYVLSAKNWLKAELTPEETNRLRRQLSDLPKPAGLFLPMDKFYPNILDMCQGLDLRIPEDLAILGVDNDSKYCLDHQPALSSIDLGAERIGFAAMKLLLELIHGKATTEEIKIPPAEVVSRDSTRVDYTTDEDPAIRLLLDFMHTNLAEPLQIEDIMLQSGLKRRALERRFQKVCGTSPKQYLISLRLEKVRQLLETTRLSVSEIGQLSGIPKVSYLCEMYRKRYGLTPLEFRQRQGCLVETIKKN
ncbi:MAG: substrate-binding domain-containing protein [Lentisphaeria bacterium]|nr:substrate-binding domain-containing protein [Lentisphaeria bacterium]